MHRRAFFTSLLGTAAATPAMASLPRAGLMPAARAAACQSSGMLTASQARLAASMARLADAQAKLAAARAESVAFANTLRVGASGFEMEITEALARLSAAREAAESVALRPSGLSSASGEASS